MILSVGEILFDYFPQYRRMGGAPYNFAFHLKKFGFDVRFVSRVGMDGPGEEIRSAVEGHGFDPYDLQTDPERPTGAVDIILGDRGTPAFTIRENAAYDRLEVDARLRACLEEPPELIYFGSLIQRTEEGFETIRRILGGRPAGVKTLYDVNLRPGCYSGEIIERSLAEADIVKLNADELIEIAAVAGAGGDEQAVCLFLMKKYSVETLCVTDGPRGSRIYKNGAAFAVSASKDIRVADTVGAGDAFASVLAVGCMRGWEPEKTLRTAGAFAEAVCGIKGALPESAAFYEPFGELMKKEDYEK